MKKSLPKELRDVIKKVRQLLRRKTPVFVHIIGENSATYTNLSEAVLLLGLNDKLMVLTVLDGSERKPLSLFRTGSLRIKEIEEIDQKEISRELGRLRQYANFQKQ